MDAMWKNFIIMINLLYCLELPGRLAHRNHYFEGFHPVFEALLSVTLILFFLSSPYNCHIHRGDNRIIWVRYYREKQAHLEKLRKKIVATRFMTLKYITSSISQDKVDFAKMDMEMPDFTKSLVRIIEHLGKKILKNGQA